MASFVVASFSSSPRQHCQNAQRDPFKESVLMVQRRTRLAALFGISAALASSTAGATGYLTARFGADHGSPAIANAYAVYFNPAALGGITGSSLSLDAAILWRLASYDRPESALTPSAGTADAYCQNLSAANCAEYKASNTGKSQLNNVAAVPYLGYATDFGGSDFHLGAAAYVPFGGSADWGRNTFYKDSLTTPGGYDGAQRWATISGKIQALYATLAGSYTLRDLRLSVGANVSFIHQAVQTVRARNTDGSDDTRATDFDRFQEGRSLLDVKGSQIGAAVGVYWEPLEDRSVTVGASYTSQPGFGESRLKGKLYFTPGTSVAETTPTGDVDLLQSFPAVWRAGATWKVDADRKWEIRTDFVYAQWSVFDKQCIVTSGANCDLNADGSQKATGVVVNIPRNWKDAWGLKLGAAHYLNRDVELFGSLGYTTPAAPSSTVDASTIDNTRYTAAFGTKFAVSDHLAFATSAAVVYFKPITVTDSIYETQKGESKSPSANGSYKQIVPILDLNASYTF